MDTRDIIERFEHLENLLASLCSLVHAAKEDSVNHCSFFESCLENAVEIGQIAALLEKDDKIIIDDGEELAMFCVELAKKFEEQYDPEGADYYGEIDAFTSERLLQRYGVDREPEPSYIKSDEAYRTYMHAPCYVIDKKGAWGHSQLLALVHGDEELCEEMFNKLEGENPQVFIESQLDNGYWTKCEVCGRLYNSNVSEDPALEIDECPICHTPIPGDEPFDVAVDRELGYL